jgi:uncharacterized protein (DUF983 family)
LQILACNNNLRIFYNLFPIACTDGVIFWNSFFKEATSCFLCGDVVTTNNDALDSGSYVLILMQGTTRIWKSGIEFFWPHSSAMNHRLALQMRRTQLTVLQD